MKGYFKTNLLREKFTLTDPAGRDAPVIALSNRLVLNLTHPLAAEPPETFIIRTQNMHSCVRFGAAIAKEYLERGAIMDRMVEFRWNNLWHDVIKGYEKDWNPDIWAAVYHRGRVVFEDKERHPLLDIIEKCDAASGADYNQSVAFAESAFQQAGRKRNIAHDSNLALIVNVDPEEIKCGIMLRGANRKTTFNYIIKPKKEGAEQMRLPTVLTLSAAFLEGVQLSFHVGMANRKRTLGLIEKYSDEDRKGKRGSDRLINLTSAIEKIENKYAITYRPERPDFMAMAREAEEFAGKILRPLVEEKIAKGELPDENWVE